MFQDREQTRMARSFAGSNKPNTSDARSNKTPKGVRVDSNIMSSSMPSSALSKVLYPNMSSTNQRNNSSINYGNKNVPNKRNQISKARQTLPESSKKVPKQILNSQVSLRLSNAQL